MDIDEYAERSLEIGQGFNTLLNDIYDDAITDNSPIEKVNKLLEGLQNKIKLYEILIEDCPEVWKEELKYDYSRYIQKAHNYIKQLMEKYPDNK